MTLYNLTQLQESTGLYDLITYANDATGGIMMGLFLISIFFIMLFSMKKYDFDDTLLAAGWVCFILSLVLRYAGLINFLFVIGFLAITAFTTFYVMVVKKK